MATLRNTPASTSAPGLQVISGNATRRRQADLGIVHAKSQDGLLTWSYSSALFPSFNHAEILIAGLDPFLANSIISNLVQLISRGKSYAEGSTVENALNHLVCVFRQMPTSAAAKLMPSLGGRPALQLIYPDTRNRLPWQDGHHSSWREVQPLFMIGEPLGQVECRFLEAAMHRPLLADRRRPEQPHPMADPLL